MDMLLTAWNVFRVSAIRAHLIMLALLRGNGYRVPVSEITKGKTVSPEQSYGSNSVFDL